MELNHLRVFFEVARIGRFSEAARRLNISQSALSRSVALLEESEGVKLFERSKRGVTLTPVGEDVFRHCEQLFQTFNKIEEVCRGIRTTCEGPLRFATTDHVTNDLLVQPLQNFRREFPAVIPSIFTGTPEEIMNNLLNTDCEFGLLFTKIPTPQIDYQIMRAEPMVLVVHPDVWRENKAATQQATIDRVLEKVGYLSSIGALAQTRPTRVLNELFGKMPRIGFEANNQETQKRICVARGGIAYLARFMVDQEIKSGQLHEINVGEPHLFNLWLATKKGRALSLSATTFLDRLRTAWGHQK
jgi:LysR family transcriptional regulator, cyn operon transcriptional activator